jgi:hypothetical protein
LPRLPVPEIVTVTMSATGAAPTLTGVENLYAGVRGNTCAAAWGASKSRTPASIRHPRATTVFSSTKPARPATELIIGVTWPSTRSPTGMEDGCERRERGGSRRLTMIYTSWRSRYLFFDIGSKPTSCGSCLRAAPTESIEIQKSRGSRKRWFHEAKKEQLVASRKMFCSRWRTWW